MTTPTVVVRDALPDDALEFGETRRLDKQRPVLALERAVVRLHLAVVAAAVEGLGEPHAIAEHQLPRPAHPAPRSPADPPRADPRGAGSGARFGASRSLERLVPLRLLRLT
jgi:hypothetical protein